MPRLLISLEYILWAGRVWLEEGRSKSRTGEAVPAALGSLVNPGTGGKHPDCLHGEKKPLAHSICVHFPLPQRHHFATGRGCLFEGLYLNSAKPFTQSFVKPGI